MRAKTTLNMEKTVQNEWFYLLCGVIAVGNIMLRHFIKKYVESRA